MWRKHKTFSALFVFYMTGTWEIKCNLESTADKDKICQPKANINNYKNRCMQCATLLFIHLCDDYKHKFAPYMWNESYRDISLYITQKSNSTATIVCYNNHFRNTYLICHLLYKLNALKLNNANSNKCSCVHNKQFLSPIIIFFWILGKYILCFAMMIT